MSTDQMSRRGLLATGLGSAIALGLGACAPSGDSPPSGNGDDKTDKLTFTSWSMNEDTVKANLGGLLDGWSDRTGVSIKTPSYPYSDYLAQVLLQIRGGAVSGAAQTDIAWLATLAATGRLVDLGASASKADYTDSALAACQVNGVQYGLPWTIAAIGMVYNADLLGDAGIATAPVTIEQFEAALEALRGIGVTPYAAMTKLAQLNDIIPWMWQFGSPVYDGTELTLGDQASVAAVEWYKDLLARKLIVLEVDRFDARALFAQGKVGFYEDAIGARNAIAKSASDQSIVAAMTPMPRPMLAADDKPAALAWGHAIVVIDAEGRGTAAELAEYLTGDPEAAVAYFSSSSVAPTTRTALDSPEVAGDKWVTEFTTKVTVGGRANPFWTFPQFSQIEERLGHHVQRVLLGEASAQAAMNDARKDIADLIGK